MRTAETLEGGINRNSSPQAITSVRTVYDRFLAKFPLFFGYWKKYADLEFSIAGTEAAEMVFKAPALCDKANGDRSMSAVSQVSRTLSISGQIIAPLKLRPATIPTLFESKYKRRISLPQDMTTAQASHTG